MRDNKKNKAKFYTDQKSSTGKESKWNRKGLNRRMPDPTLMIVVIILVFTSLVIVYSASSARAYELTGDSSFFLFRQLMRVVIGFVGLVFLSKLDYRVFRFAGLPLLIIAVIALVILLIPGVTEPVKGAKRAFILMGQSFQPAEIAKFALILFMADSVTRRGDDLKTWPGFLRRIFIIGIVSGLIVLQPDFSTGLIIGLIGVFILFIGGTKPGYLLISGIPLLFVAYKVAFAAEYRILRVRNWWTGVLHPDQIGHQVNQSLIGLGDGGMFGLGIGMSHQKQFFLPEPFTDFVFSILGEELGFIGTAMTVVLFIIIAYRGIKIALNAPDSFGFVLSGAITFAIVTYGFINLMVVTGLLPVSGLPLPFLTYGGSSLIFTMFMVGILLSISRSCTMESEKNIKRKNSNG